MENESFFNKRNIANAVLTALVVTGVVFVVSFLWMSNTQLHELKVLNTQILGELGEIKTEFKGTQFRARNTQNWARNTHNWARGT